MTPALVEWIEAHYATLVRYAVFRCRGDEAMAHDLLQELFTLMCEGRLNVDLSRSPLTVMQWAMRSRQYLVQGDDVVVGSFDEEWAVQPLWVGDAASPQLETMRDWITELPEEQQEAIRTYCQEGSLPAKSKARYHLQQARKKLKEKAQALAAGEASGDRAHGDGSPSRTGGSPAT